MCSVTLTFYFRHALDIPHDITRNLICNSIEYFCLRSSIESSHAITSTCFFTANIKTRLQTTISARKAALNLKNLKRKVRVSRAYIANISSQLLLKAGNQIFLVELYLPTGENKRKLLWYIIFKEAHIAELT